MPWWQKRKLLSFDVIATNYHQAINNKSLIMKILSTPNLTAIVCLSLNILPAFSQDCSDLIFSQYLEGTSKNKALEIYNPAPFPVDLNPYEVRVYFNGATDSAGTVRTMKMSGVLQSGDVYVIAGVGIDSSIFDITSIDTFYSASFMFNGDDAVSLLKDSSHIDIIGEIGVDPGASWKIGSGSTKDHTLVRKINIAVGQIEWSQAANEWDIFQPDTTELLGWHINCCVDRPQANFVSADTVYLSNGGNIDFSNTSNNAAGYEWDFGDGSPLSSEEHPTHQYTSPGAYTVVLVASYQGCSDQFSKAILVLDEGTHVDDMDDLTFRISPNPSNGRLLIQLDSRDMATITIWDSFGKMVYNNVIPAGRNKHIVELRISGIYFINLRKGNKKYSGRFVLIN